MNSFTEVLGTMRWRQVAIAVIASTLVVGSIALGTWGRWLSPAEVVDPSDCDGWNTEGYFKRATAGEVGDCLQMGADVRDRSADGITPLFWAAREAMDPEAIAVLLSAGADVNERLEIEGVLATPLLVAASEQYRAAVIGVLLDAGADPNFRGPKGQTALHFAAGRGKSDIVSLLLEHGSQPNTADDNGQTPLKTVTELFARGWDHHGRIANEISVIRSLLGSGADATDLADRGWTELHTAALVGNDPDEISALVDQGLDPSAETSSGWRASHLAAFGNEDPRIISTLLDLGVNPNATIGDAGTVDLRRQFSELRNRRSSNARIGDGRTPLHCAAFSNPNPLVIGALIEGGANPNAGTTTGWTPLHAAVYANPNPHVAEALLKGGADANSQLKETWTMRDLFPYLQGTHNEDDKWDSLMTLEGTSGRSLYLKGLSTPLHVAVEFPQDRSVVGTLIRRGADPRARDVEGETPLHQVENSADAITLIDAGADPNARDEDGRTPLHNAVSHAGLFGNVELVSALIDGGANPNTRSASGWAPLHVAATLTRVSTTFPAAGPQTDAKLISLLIRRGGNPNVQDDYGTTPLHLAAQHKTTNPLAIEALLRGSADPNSRNLKGETPLFNAVGPSLQHLGEPSSHAVVVSLVEAGADPNLRDENGRTPLHSALARFTDAKIIDTLLDGGAKVSLSDRDGITPWDLAQGHDSLKGSTTYWRLNEARFE